MLMPENPRVFEVSCKAFMFKENILSARRPKFNICKNCPSNLPQINTSKQFVGGGDIKNANTDILMSSVRLGSCIYRPGCLSID